MQRTGTSGERRFQAWCSDADITCNQAHEDYAGWDFKLDFPLPKNPELREIHKGAPHCLIQVKSTRSKSLKSISLKLSNMYRHATVLEPVFVVLIRFGANNKPKECHLIHIGISLMERALMRVATAIQEGQFKELHKQRFSVPLNEGVLLAECGGNALRDEILKLIGGNVYEYIENKRVALDRLGFSDLPSTVSFSIDDKHNLKRFLLACLGKEQSTEVRDVTFRTERFGRTDESLSQHQATAVLSVKPEAPLSTGSLLIGSQEYGPFCEFSAEIFVLPFHSAIPDHLPAFRLVAGPVEIVINKSYTKAEFHISFDYKTPTDFSGIERFGRLLAALIDSKGNLYIRVRMPKAKGWSQIIHMSDDFTREHGWIQNDAELIANAVSLFQYFEIDRGTLISMEQLITSQSRIATFSNLVSGRKIAFKVTFDMEDGRSISYSHAIYVSRLGLRVGNIAMALIVSIPGDISFDADGSISLHSHELDVFQKFVGFLPDNEIDSKLSALVQQLASSLEENNNVIVDVDSVK